MSSEIIWQISRDSSCFLVKHGKNHFSRATGNILAKQSPQCSTLSSSAVMLLPAPVGVDLVFKNKKTGKPVKVSLKHKSVSKTAKSIANILTCYNRADLIPAAVLRAKKIYKTQAPQKTVAKQFLPRSAKA